MAMESSAPTNSDDISMGMAKGVDESESGVSGSFECNICLDTVQDPVVTLCGHLYCWPCIYKWIHIHHQRHTSSQAHCPVCKTQVSQNTIVPLYGTKEKAPSVGTLIPPRPNSTPRYQGLVRRGYQQHAPPPLAMPGRGGMTIDTHVVVPSPTIGMLGEMVSGRILGDVESPLFATPNSYHIIGNGTRRERWQTTQADKSLSRIFYTFFFCCIIFCILLFT